MSVDYVSACISLAPARARVLVSELGENQYCGAIIGPDEESFAEGWRGPRKIDWT